MVQKIEWLFHKKPMLFDPNWRFLNETAIFDFHQFSCEFHVGHRFLASDDFCSRDAISTVPWEPSLLTSSRAPLTFSFFAAVVKPISPLKHGSPLLGQQVQGRATLEHLRDA